MQIDPNMTPIDLTPMIGNAAGADRQDFDAPVATETQELTWMLLDGVIEQQQREKLSGLLAENESSRREYVAAVQLHSDLLTIFGGL